MKERKAWQAIVSGKCPQCREGDMFTESILKSPLKMNEKCPKCDLTFEREPGFFYGAMYVSYALSVAIFVITMVTMYFLMGDPSITAYIIGISIVSLILYPVTYRYSRIIFIYLLGNVSFKSEQTG